MAAEQNEVLPGVKRRPDIRWEAIGAGDIVESPGLTITEAHLVSWAGLTGDWVSLHLDEQYAAATPFGRRIGHGPLTFSVALGLLTQTGYFSNVAAWLGADAIRAVQPVFIGDTIRVTATVREARPTKKPERGLWALDYVVRNQRDEPVMTFTSSFLVLREAATTTDELVRERRS